MDVRCERCGTEYELDDSKLKKGAVTVKCANCGYVMEGLSMPRCPECGALRGFKVPLDKLGLSEDEIRAGFEATARRRTDRGES